jgi:hypothetical protein
LSYPLRTLDAHQFHHSGLTDPHSTQLDDARDTSPYPSRSILGGIIAPEQTQETDIVEPDPRSQELPSASPTIDSGPVRSTSRVTSASTKSSIYESIETVALDLEALPSIETSHRLHPPSLATANLTTNITRPGQPAPDAPIAQMGESSQILAATSFTFSHRDHLPVTGTPSTAPHPPPVSAIQKSGDSLNTSSPVVSLLT